MMKKLYYYGPSKTLGQDPPLGNWLVELHSKKKKAEYHNSLFSIV